MRWPYTPNPVSSDIQTFLRIELEKIRNALADVANQGRHQTSIAINSAATVALPTSGTGIVEVKSDLFGTAIIAEFINAGTGTVLSTIHAGANASVVATAGALSGTTGPLGKLNIAITADTLHIENQTAAARQVVVSFRGI